MPLYESQKFSASIDSGRRTWEIYCKPSADWLFKLPFGSNKSNNPEEKLYNFKIVYLYVALFRKSSLRAHVSQPVWSYALLLWYSVL